MSATLIRTDKNGTKYYQDTVCPKCHGRGYLDYYGHIEQGRCFKCGGDGYFVTKWKEYTPEYREILDQKRIKRLIKKAPEANARFLLYNGFDSEGNTWVVTGNTYSIKETLKEEGARFYGPIGWHFNHEVSNHDTVLVNVSEITETSQIGEYYFKDGVDIKKVIRDKMPKEDIPSSEFIGQVKDKINIEVTYIDHRSFETPSYTYWKGNDIINVYRFNDDNGNILIWKTQSYPELEEGKRYLLSGMINQHQEYKGVKQTMLKRCKFQPL